MFFLESLIQDIGYALRLLRRSPVFTAAVTLSLALGIGANTAIFSLIDAVMWRTLPVKDPEALVLLTHSRGTTFQGGFTYQQYPIMRQQQSRGFTELAAWSAARLNVSVDGSLEPTTDGQLVSGNYFSLLGVSPVAGRMGLQVVVERPAHRRFLGALGSELRGARQAGGDHDQCHGGFHGIFLAIMVSNGSPPPSRSFHRSAAVR